jgi:metallo-beta-lactamase class B
LFFVGNSDVTAHLIDTEDGLILIDTTYPTTAAMLIQSIWEMGFNPKDIKSIIHTHGHYDHIGATELLKSISGAKTFLGARDATMMLENPELTLNYVSYYSYVDPINPDVQMFDGDVITIGNTSIRIVATPGHTAGCVSLFFNVVDNGVSYTAGMHGGVGLNTLDKRFTDKFGQIYSRDEFLNSLNKVITEPVDIVLGNHTIQNNTLKKRDGAKPSSQGIAEARPEKLYGFT